MSKNVSYDTYPPPPHILSKTKICALGIGANKWKPFIGHDWLGEVDGHIAPWPSELHELHLPIEDQLDIHSTEGFASACIGTVPRQSGDRAFTLKHLRKTNQTAVVLDCHPLLAAKTITIPWLTTGRRTWSWSIDSSSYGETQSRSRVIIVSSRLKNVSTDSISPLYIFEVKLPTVISEFMRHSCEIIQGALAVRPRHSVDVNQPTPLGWISLIPERLTHGVKTDSGVVKKVDNDIVTVSAKQGEMQMDRETLLTIPTKYQVYSQEGLTFPMWKPYPPSGFGHTIIYDINNHLVRPLSLLECWLIIGRGGGVNSCFMN